MTDGHDMGHAGDMIADGALTAGGAMRDANDASLFPQTVGERLRAAREAAGLDLNDIATRTRVPTRHLEAIERSDFTALPSITYAIGFARSYARAVGADETVITRDLRVELGRAPVGTPGETAPYEPVDPTRVPSRLLAWTALALLVVFLIGYGAWRSEIFGSAGAPPIAAGPVEPATMPAAVSPAPAPTVGGQVVLTATQPVWLKIYDKAGTRLIEKEMAAGEAFTVPREADTPMILTGRPDALRVTVDGREVAPLGNGSAAIKDVGISAAALASRPATSAAVVPALRPVPATPRRVRDVHTRDPVIAVPSAVAAPAPTVSNGTE